MKSNDNHLRYIGEMTVELAKMARVDRFDLLATILELAADEAKSAAEKSQNAQYH